MSASTLPHDILRLIFEAVAQLPWEPSGEESKHRVEDAHIPFPWIDTATILAVSHVSGRWRNSILQTPACWKTMIVNCAQDADSLRREAHKISVHMRRAINHTFTIILLSEIDVGISVVELPMEFLSMMRRSIKGASRLYFRFLQLEYAENLSKFFPFTPQLEEIAIWFLDDRNPFEAPSILGNLKYTPALRKIWIHGLSTREPTNFNIELPSIHEVLVDEGKDSAPIRDHTPFLQRFHNVKLLTLIFYGISSDLTVTETVVFPNLEFLEMNIESVYVLFTCSHRIDAPKLRVFSMRIFDMMSGAICEEIAPVAHTLQASSASSKSLIVSGFAALYYDASHVRMLQSISVFHFTNHLEFRQCNLTFSEQWNSIWTANEDIPWDALFNDEVPGKHEPISPAQADPEELEDETTRKSPGGQNQYEESSNPLPDASFSPCFMPSLRSIAFNDCLFLNTAGAGSFANALAFRQGRLARDIDGSG